MKVIINNSTYISGYMGYDYAMIIWLFGVWLSDYNPPHLKYL